MNQMLELLPQVQPTQHAMLVVWGQFAQEIGLLDQLATVPIAQKTVQHTLLPSSPVCSWVYSPAYNT